MADQVTFDPGSVMAQVDEGATHIEGALDAAAGATERAANAERAYEQAFEKELLTIYHEAKRAGERMPAEDVRRAIAHERMGTEVYAAHLLAKAQLVSAEKKARGIEKALSARQSLLKALTGAG